MEDVLTLYAQPPDPKQPVVCLDERPVVLHADARPSLPASPGKAKRVDYEYERRGTANIFCVTAPKLGIHLTHATPDRKTVAFAAALELVIAEFQDAELIHLVVDNLSTHSLRALCGALGEDRAAAIWARFRVHYTPKHGSWLNQAETEASLWSRECLGGRRLSSFEELQKQTGCVECRCQCETGRTIAWEFRSSDAQRVFGYQPPVKTP